MVHFVFHARIPKTAITDALTRFNDFLNFGYDVEGIFYAVFGEIFFGLQRFGHRLRVVLQYEERLLRGNADQLPALVPKDVPWRDLDTSVKRREQDRVMNAL